MYGNEQDQSSCTIHGIINEIKNDIETLEAACENGDLDEDDKLSAIESHEEDLRNVEEMMDGEDADAFDENFKNDTYINRRQRNFKPKSQNEYSDVDVQLITEPSNTTTKQIKRIANDFSNNYVSCFVQSEKQGNVLSTLRCNAVKVMDNAKISISKYNISFQNIMRRSIDWHRH